MQNNWNKPIEQLCPIYIVLYTLQAQNIVKGNAQTEGLNYIRL